MAEDHEIVGVMRFSTGEEPVARDYPLYKTDFDEIVRKFKQNEAAYDKFLEYCKIFEEHVGNPHSEVVAPRSGFSSILTRIIDAQVGYGAAFIPLVIQEMMILQGIDVDWGVGRVG